MTIKELEGVFKKIYGEDCFRYDNYSNTRQLCSDILYQLDYDNDDTRNMMVLSQEEGGDFYLTDAGDTIATFYQEKEYEIKPVVKNLMKKYGIEKHGHEYRKKIEKFDEDYLKRLASDFMSFIFGVWFFALHNSFYSYPILNRGTYYHEEHEEGLMFEDKTFEEVVKLCKKKFDTFKYDEKERMYCIEEDGKKKFLVKCENKFAFIDFSLYPERIAEHSGENIEKTFEEVVEILAKELGDKFDKNDNSFTTYIYRDNKPIKYYLKQEGKKIFFTDKGQTKKGCKEDYDIDRFASLVDCYDCKEFQIRTYLKNSYFERKDFAKEIIKNIHYCALASQNINEVDFSNVGKFATKLNDLESIKEEIAEESGCNVIEQKDCCSFETDLYLPNGKRIVLNLERGKKENYFTFKNELEGEKLDFLLANLQYPDIKYCKRKKHFKIAVYENDFGWILNKFYTLLSFVVFYANIDKFEEDFVADKDTQTGVPMGYEEIKTAISQLKGEREFFGFTTGSYGFARATEHTHVIWVFGRYRFINIPTSCYVEIKKFGDVWCLNNDNINKAKNNEKVKDKLAVLERNFNLQTTVLTKENFQTKLSNMVQFILCAKMAGYWKEDK